MSGILTVNPCLVRDEPCRFNYFASVSYCTASSVEKIVQSVDVNFFMTKDVIKAREKETSLTTTKFEWWRITRTDHYRSAVRSE
jgi:hypothetical protein